MMVLFFVLSLATAVASIVAARARRHYLNALAAVPYRGALMDVASSILQDEAAPEHVRRAAMDMTRVAAGGRIWDRRRPERGWSSPDVIKENAAKHFGNHGINVFNATCLMAIILLFEEGRLGAMVRRFTEDSTPMRAVEGIVAKMEDKHRARLRETEALRVAPNLVGGSPMASRLAASVEQRLALAF